MVEQHAVSRRGPGGPEPALPLAMDLFDTSRMNLHLEPDVDPRKGITSHRAWITLPNGLTLSAIRIARGIGGNVKIEIPQPCPATTAGGAKLTPARLDDLQRGLLNLWIREKIDERIRERRADSQASRQRQ